jgi:hypothetical protein
MSSSGTTQHPLMESLERMKEVSREAEIARQDAIRRYNEAERRKQEVYAQMRQRSRPLLARLKEAVFG